jgi:glyoxylase-like metal-dependent hydrolase (beta-lactamase superfamily II)
MTTKLTFAAGDLTIHRIVEMAGPAMSLRQILPGPHHVAVLLGKGRDEAAFAGDLVHSPLQWRVPDLASAFDRDPAAAVTSRRAFLERYAETGTVCCFAHTPSPSAGFVRRLRGGFTCVGV